MRLPSRTPLRRFLTITVLVSLHAAAVQAATPAELTATYAAQAGSPGETARGQLFFTTQHGQAWSCATCHGARPVQPGRHAATGRTIAALAPAFNPERLTDPAKVEKWLRRNCNDVVGRECTAAEKADVLTWLTSIKP